MADISTLTPEQQAVLEESRAAFTQLQGQLGKALTHARDSVAHHVKVAQERLSLAQRDHEQAAGLRELLAPRQAEPGAAEHYQKMVLLEEVYGQMKAMSAIELGIQERNLKEIEAIPPLELRADYPVDIKPQVYLAHDDVGYLEHRTRLDVAQLDYHWFRNRRALDAVMRAAGTELTAYEAGDEEAAQAAAAETLKAEAAAQQDAQIMIGRLGPELEEAFALLDWAKDSLVSLGQLPKDAKREAMADPDYLKLVARLQMIQELPDRVKEMPALAKLFPYAGPVPSPFQVQPL